MSEFAVLANRAMSYFGSSGLSEIDFEAKATSEYIHCIISDYYTALGRSKDNIKSGSTSDIAPAILAIFDLRARLSDYKIPGPFEERKTKFLADVRLTTRDANATPKPVTVEHWGGDLARMTRIAWDRRNIFFRGFRSVHVDEEVAQAMHDLGAAMEPVYTLLDSLCADQYVHGKARGIIAAATTALESIHTPFLPEGRDCHDAGKAALDEVVKALAASPFLQPDGFAWLVSVSGKLTLRLWDPRLKYDPPLVGMVDAVKCLCQKLPGEYYKYLRERIEVGGDAGIDHRAGDFLLRLEQLNAH